MALLIVVALMASVFVGCSQEPETTEENNVEKENTTTEETNEEKEAEEVAAVDTRKVFVTPEWVKSVIDGQQPESENYIILEASWGTADDSPDYNTGHIPGAIHVNTDSIEEGPIWNIRSAEEVEQAMLDLGITKDTVVIIYSTDPSAGPRVSYTYLWAGVENVKMLDGGLGGWTSAGYDLETEANEPTPATEFGVEVPANPQYWLSLEDTANKLEEDDNFRLVSIRSYEEFAGETSGYSYIPKAGEPKGAVWGKAGSDPSHMEDYVHEDGTYISMEEMEELWADLDFSTENEISFYCGTGWRATIPFLIMYENGYDTMSMYDGGWNEWQMNDELPVQVGDPNSDDVVYTTVGELSDNKAAQ